MFSDNMDSRAQSLGAAALRLLLEQLPGAGVCLLDGAGVIEEWHVSAEKLLGHVASQVEGTRLETLFPEERRFEATLSRALFEASAHGGAKTDAGLMTRSGQRRVCTLDLHPRLDASEDVAGFIVLMRAVSPGRAVDMVNSNDNLVVAHRSNLARADNEPAWIGMDLVGRVSRLSKSAADWLGCDVEDPLGRSITDCVVPAERLDWPIVLHRAVRAKSVIKLKVTSVEEGGGQARNARLLPLRAADGRLDGFTLVIESPRKPGPAAVASSDARTPDTGIGGAGGLLAVAHDLREPLRKMHHYTQQLKTSEAPRLSDNGRRRLESMQSAVERMQSMIGGMLRLARVESSTAAGQSLNLKAVVDEACADLAVLVEEHGACFEIGALGTVVGDPDQLRALFQNLIDNSIRYRRDDVAPRIRIALAEDAGDLDRVQLDYVDNGCGISAPDEAFSPFRSNGTSQQGAGIGLPLCQRICRRHGGDLRVVETSSSGTGFRISLNDIDNDIEDLER